MQNKWKFHLDKKNIHFEYLQHKMPYFVEDAKYFNKFLTYFIYMFPPNFVARLLSPRYIL